MNARARRPVITPDGFPRNPGRMDVGFHKDNPNEPAVEARDVVAVAVASWRNADSRIPAERLSPGARANVRALARRASDDPADRALERPLARLFLPAGRISVIAAVPALVLAFSLGWLLNSGAPRDEVVSIETSKTDGQAVFDIANGGRTHRVYRSTSARDLGQADLFATVEGGFSDSLTGDETLVFYRID